MEQEVLEDDIYSGVLFNIHAYNCSELLKTIKEDKKSELEGKTEL